MLRYLVVLFCLLTSSLVQAQESAASNKKIIYKKYTEVDLTGETVHGQARMPALFYIFQRKRAGRLEAAQAPENFRFLGTETIKAVEGNSEK